MFTKPAADKFEIIVFGSSSNFGECILVHLKNDQWLVIDSFYKYGKQSKDKEAIAKYYLKNIYGEEWKNKVVYLLITHYDADHIWGISEILNESENLKSLWIASATKDEDLEKLLLTPNEIFKIEKLKKIEVFKELENKVSFLTSLASYQVQIDSFDQFSTIISEVRANNNIKKRYLDYLSKLKKEVEGKQKKITLYGILHRLHEEFILPDKTDTIIEMSKIGEWMRKNNNHEKVSYNSNPVLINNIKIDFISPTKGIIQKVDKININNRNQKPLNRKKQTINPNTLSVGILIDYDKNKPTVLLAADIEKNWDEIINNFVESPEKYRKSDVFKVAHHGSENGFSDDVWDKLLVKNPISIVTCYDKKKTLPTIEYATIIEKLSGESYITNDPYDKSIKLENSDINIGKFPTGKVERLEKYGFGYVKLTEEIENWKIELYGTALKITDLLKKV